MLCVALAAITAACTTPEAPESSAVSDAERAAAALQPLKKRLMGELTRALEDGPEAAIAVCRVRAPAIAREVASKGVRVGRSSHRLRNPANAPEPWMEPLLMAFVEDPGSAAPQTVHIGPDAVGYVEPIFVQPMCLTCHGTDLPTEVRDKLAMLYPQDRATGFASGDFRGIFWVALERESPGDGSR